MTSLNDIRIVSSPISAGKALCMCRGIAMICLHIHWHPHQLFSSAMQEPCNIFHNPNFEHVTLSSRFLVYPCTRASNLLLEYDMICTAD